MIWITDPTNSFPTVQPGRLLAACGFIPSFIEEADQRPALDQFRERYRFGVSDLPHVTIDHRGIWQYRAGEPVDPEDPPDPPLPPLLKGELRDETIYIYQHAFVAIVQKDGSVYATRMD